MPPFQVTLVLADGVQRDVGKPWHTLSEALNAKARHAVKLERAGHTRFDCVVLVHDVDDPERGYFSWDDVEAAA
jgi:hypothetical protein